MHEVERGAFGKPVGNDVVPANRQIGVRELLEEARFQVGCEDLAIISDTSTQPGRDRPAAGTNFPATPSRADP